MTDKPFYLQISHQLMVAAKIAGVEPDDLVGLLNDQVHAMRACEPNFPKGRKRPPRRAGLNSPLVAARKATLEEQQNDMWILRGFFPNTTLMYKISLVHITKGSEIPAVFGERDDWFARASFVSPPTKDSKKYHFISEDVEQRLLERTLEKNVFGETTAQPIVETKFKLPRCMAPKGMKWIKRKIQK